MRTRRPSLITLTGLLSTLVSTLAIPALVLAQSPSGESIGIVIAVRGQVEALDASGAVRQLTRGADVFAADTIAVGPEGYAQVRMVDEALISLKSDTSFTISSYEFDGNPATPDSATMSMVRGGFRTISGSIGDADEDTYRIDTPHASIGIRGTMHSAIIVEGVLYTGVYDGGTTISNNLGSIDAGIGADFDYTETIGNEAPRGLIESPAVLGLVNLTPLLAQDAAGTAPADGSNADGADTNSPNTNAAPAALAALANGDASPGSNAAQNASPIVAANTPPATALIESNATITGGDPQDDLNPLRFSRGAADLDQSASDDGDAGGNNNGNAGNGNAGGNNGNSGNGNAGGNNGNSGNGNAGGNNGNSGNGNAGGNNGNSGNGNAGGNSGNSGNGNAGGNSGNSGNGNAGGNSGNSGNGNAGGNSGNSGNGNAGDNSGNSGNGNAGGNNGNSGNGNAGGNNGNSGNGNAGGNNGNAGNGNAGGNTGGNGGNAGNGNAGGNTGGNGGNAGNGNAGGNTGGNGGNAGNGNAGGNNGNSGNGRDNSTFPTGTRAIGLARAEQLPQSADALVLAWGVWDNATPVAQNSIRRTVGLFFNGDAERAVVIPANMADLSGTVSYASAGRFAGTDATGAALRDVHMAFDVDLAGGPGAITNGQLRVIDGHHKTWSAAFDGSVTNASAIMNNVSGTYADKPLTGSIQGVFTGTGARPDFVSGFVLQSDGAFVQGITELTSD